MTIKKSRQFHGDLRYASGPVAKPKATILMHISMKKAAVKKASAMLRLAASTECGSTRGVSSARQSEEAMMTMRMAWLNALCAVSCWNARRVALCGPNRQRE